MTVKVENLTGGYGKTPVINNINFELKSGEIVGLIGLNGAGKSTTIKHMLGLLNPMQGKLSISNVDINEDVENYRKKLSYIPESPVIYDELTLQEHIYMTAMAYGIDRETAMERAEPLLQTFRLKQELGIFPSHFSKGMKQKVMITCAFVIQPSLFVIDEPFIGLDPVAMMDLENLLLEEKAKGNSILMSTHVLTNAEKVCDSFVILHDGHVFAKGTTDELAKTFHLKGADLEEIYRYVAQEEGFGHDA